MLDVVARKLCNPMHYFKHSRDDLLQEPRLFADNFIYDFVCQRHKVQQPIEKSQWHLVVFALLLQELYGQVLPPVLLHQ